KQVAHFEEDDTVLAWFRRNWDCSDAEELLGFRVYGFRTIFERAAENDLAPPANDEQLAEYLQQYLYSEGPILCEPHLVTVQTDDDDLEVAYYVFDDHFAKRYPARVAFLLHDGWRLPTDSAKKKQFRPKEPTKAVRPAGKGDGATFYVREV